MVRSLVTITMRFSSNLSQSTRNGDVFRMRYRSWNIINFMKSCTTKTKKNLKTGWGGWVFSWKPPYRIYIMRTVLYITYQGANAIPLFYVYLCRWILCLFGGENGVLALDTTNVTGSGGKMSERWIYGASCCNVFWQTSSQIFSGVPRILRVPNRSIWIVSLRCNQFPNYPLPQPETPHRLEEIKQKATAPETYYVNIIVPLYHKLSDDEALRDVVSISEVAYILEKWLRVCEKGSREMFFTRSNLWWW